MSVPYGYDPARLRAARDAGGLTVDTIAAGAGLTSRAVSHYLAGTRDPRACVLPRLARAAGLADPLDLCDLGDGEQLVHLRVRVGLSRPEAAAAVGWHVQTYARWETTARGYAPFFRSVVVQRGREEAGVWRQPVLSWEYDIPERQQVFAVPAERLLAARDRTRITWAAEEERRAAEDPVLAADLAAFVRS